MIMVVCKSASVSLYYIYVQKKTIEYKRRYIYVQNDYLTTVRSSSLLSSLGSAASCALISSSLRI